MIRNNFFLSLTLLAPMVLATTFAHAHSHEDENAPLPNTKNVQFEKRGDMIYVTSNGLPNHTTGSFPNRGNPNSISAQSISVQFTAHPALTNKQTDVRVPAIALNGVLFEPGTAECYGKERGGMERGMERGGRRPPPHHLRGGHDRRLPPRGGMEDCQWHEEGIVNGHGQLGMDQNNAHVQPTGLYHYHGVPTGLIKQLPTREDGLIHVGYAADGFKLFYDPSGNVKSSYKLREGYRPQGEGNPGGQYDGTYTEDFVYVADHSDLDMCNGAEVGGKEDGEYAYFVTEAFPFAPRCLWGTPDSSFFKRGPR